MTEVLYSLYARIYCAGIILVNDVPVLEWLGEQTKEGGYGGETPVNSYILQTGTHKVVGKMYPRYGNKFLTENETMEIEFHIADKQNWKKSQRILQPKIASPWNGLSENIRFPTFEITSELKAELPFVLEGWQNSVDLTKSNQKALFQEVIAFYTQLHSVIRQGNATKFQELSSGKFELQKEAFYFNEERKQRFFHDEAQWFASSVKLDLLEETDLDLQFMGYGKLVRLVRKDGFQPLRLQNPAENELSVEMDIKLHRKKTGQPLSLI